MRRLFEELRRTKNSTTKQLENSFGKSFSLKAMFRSLSYYTLPLAHYLLFQISYNTLFYVVEGRELCWVSKQNNSLL